MTTPTSADDPNAVTLDDWRAAELRARVALLTAATLAANRALGLLAPPKAAPSAGDEADGPPTLQTDARASELLTAAAYAFNAAIGPSDPPENLLTPQADEADPAPAPAPPAAPPPAAPPAAPPAPPQTS